MSIEEALEYLEVILQDELDWGNEARAEAVEIAIQELKRSYKIQ